MIEAIKKEILMEFQYGLVLLSFMFSIFLLFYLIDLFARFFKELGKFLFVFGDKENNSSKKHYGILSGILDENWWIWFGIFSSINFFHYNIVESNKIKEHKRAFVNYEKYSKELNYVSSQLQRGGTICNDGWRSDSGGGQGSCSHHGGVNRDISYYRYDSLLSQVKRYEEIKSDYWIQTEIKKNIDNHLNIEYIIIILSLSAYMVIKNSENKK